LRRSGRAAVKMCMADDSESNASLLDELSLEEDGVSKVRKKKQSKTEKALKNLKSKQDVNSTFMSDFNPNVSRREKAKVGRKPLSSKAKSTIYDDKGSLLGSGLDLCDCLDDDCPGCHFPCSKCRSNKCGHECRQNRKWQYDTVEIDGLPATIRNNAHLVPQPTK